MKALVIISALFLCCFGVISCSDSNDSSGSPTPKTYTFRALLTAVSGTGSTAYGDATLQFNESTKKFTLTVNYTGLVANTGHIHGADTGIVFDLSSGMSPLSNPINYTSPVLKDSQITELMANHYYINLHTTAFPNGEISGTLVKTGSSGGGGGVEY